MRVAKIVAVLFVLISSIAIGAPQPIPESLRGGIKADPATIDNALIMQDQGWEYVMPQPKSKQARWGNGDGRTTWWVGYWKNKENQKTSAREPKFIEGKFEGDNQGGQSWRRGGSPGRPSELEWLLSKHGGVQP